MKPTGVRTRPSARRGGSCRLGRVLLAAGCAFGLAAAGRAAETAFGFAQVRAKARALAAAPDGPSRGEVPEWLRRLTYDDLRRIAFDGRHSLWQRERLPFQVQFLHPGFLLDRMVQVAEVRDGRAVPVPFRREFFQYRGITPGEMPATMGFAGFRLMFPFDGPGTPPAEAGSFAGASYFRFLAAGTAYGLSARGLALDTAAAGAEEFPRFTEFWLERPAPGAGSAVVLALLESPSVTGAYRFEIEPGAVTTMQVKAALFVRRPSEVFGLAPLTSMYWHGENASAAAARDFRPEVHDSDGLLLHTGAGEWLWRPLANPRTVRTAAFADENPRGFGLLQRDRDFENYQDLEASYHTRPGAWVEPVGRWGRGAVRLVEIPTKTEFDDNVVAFWVPEKAPAAGETVEIEYRLHWFRDQIGPPAGFVRSTRHGPTAYYEAGMERFVVDFAGGALGRKTADSAVEPVVEVGTGGTLHHAAGQKNPINGTWRLAFTVRPDGTGRPVELRAFLRQGDDVLTETWSYLWQP